MSWERRRGLVERSRRRLSVVRQCKLLSISCSSVYYQCKPTPQRDLELMAALDRQYLDTPYFGSRRMQGWLQAQGHCINRKRVWRLMRTMGLAAIYQRPQTSRGSPTAARHPYLLRGLAIRQPNQVWASDITYIPMARGFLYLGSWTGSAAVSWHGGCPTPWSAPSAWKPWRRH